jgi:hypothetical protein
MWKDAQPASLIKEMQIKVTLGYHFPSIRLEKPKV